MSAEEVDAQLTVSVPAGPILAGPLSLFAVRARWGELGGWHVPHEELLAFTYRFPVDPEAPDEPRPLRRARLIVIDDGVVGP